MSFAAFALSIALVLLASELFTNAIEWTGFRMRIAQGATGSLLAAIGTSLPETVIPIIAIIRATSDSQSIAIGAILGAPFLLITLALGITGIAVVLRKHQPFLHVDEKQFRRDIATFMVGFVLLLGSVPFSRPVHWVVAVALLLLYSRNAIATLRGSDPQEKIPEPLHLVRWQESSTDSQPHSGFILVQLLLGIALLVFAGDLFVSAISDIAVAIHFPILLLALIIVPIATEMPEIVNGILWVKDGEDGLAIGNIAGSTAWQACATGSVGIAFTSWQPSQPALISSGIAMLTALYVVFVLHDGHTRGWILSLTLLPWIAYVAVAILLVQR